ncbi:MAG TPA: CHASE domain-containing protein [Rhodocyclaceae bacterium]|nr:CHASE domain-containing protein [Rhodocyclaceae bacterium]HMZ83245.1 CHASE domain-containing protein [Rhodocyclaceae bacterium]HNA03252.1 CHASE domain-containing protein [Rhodocyclaceae bacterium]HNB78534.1 CHASE domain-containing protein [Rhodocyclaceae bacterium]HNC61173.1 CHASE domain-containing protein [Rhodocyclaceae bacterium]
MNEQKFDDAGRSGRFNPGRIGRSLRPVIGRNAAWMVLVIGTITSLATLLFFLSAAQTNLRERFNNEVNQIQNLLQRRLIAHEMVLRGGAGLFDSQIEVDRNEWKQYIAALDLDRNYPGVLGVGFSKRIRAEDRAEHEDAIRSEGFADYAIRPAGERAEYTSIIYLEPFSGRNLRAFGFDMFSEPVRQEAMSRARDSGLAAMSGRVTLVQEGKHDVQPGMLLYYPVYRRTMPHGTVEERREALLGYVYSPYRAHDLFGSLLKGFGERVGIEIFDGQSTDRESLLFATPGIEALDDPSLMTTRTVEIAGRLWSFRVRSAPAIEATSELSAAWIIPLLGLAVTLALFFIARSLTTMSRRAHQLAKDMTRELGLSESRLRTILDTVADGIITLDENRRITSFSRAATRIFGYEEDQAIGLSIECLVPDVTEQWLGEQMFAGSSAAGTTESFHGEVVAERHEGTRFPVALSISRYRERNHALYTCTVRDITEKKMAEAQLLLRERALESSGNGIVISDMTLPNQPLIYANPAFERITGFSPYEVIGRNCRFLQGLDGDQPALEELRVAIAASQPCTVVLRNYRKDGTPFWNELSIAPVLDGNGRATHYVGVQNDISERMESEQTLMIRTHRLDAVFSLSSDGFAAFDELGRLTIANPALLRMTGMELDDVIGLSEAEFDIRMAALCDPSQPYVPLSEALAEAIALQATSGEQSRQFGVSTLFLISPERRIVERNVRLSESDQHEKVLYFRDITREAEVDRMKSEFLSTAAHELRTPMASIFGFAELLLKRDYDEATRRRLLDTIHRQAQLLINLVNELLDLARIEARAGKDFRRRVQPIRPVIENTVASLLVSNDARRVRVVDDANLPQLNVDHEKIQQALTNVLSNAYKYSPYGGNIELSTLEDTRNGRPMFGIRVRDEGIGMTPEQLARVFERFFRADPSGNIPGTGLGMALVQEIIELHGGSVDVQSEFGKGTIVTLWLPLIDANLEQLAA